MKYLKESKEFINGKRLVYKDKKQKKDISSIKKKKRYIEEYFTILRHIGDIP